MGRGPGESVVHGPRTSLLRHCLVIEESSTSHITKAEIRTAISKMKNGKFGSRENILQLNY